MKEHESLKGYYYLPVSESPVVINREGDLINLTNGHYHPVYISHKGYCVTPLRFENNVYRNYAVHRLLAMLFVEKPERHKDLDFENLQVNHKDGIKVHNNLDNLEWVTGKENMEHARTLGLFKNEKVVLSRDIRTGEIEQYKSVAECSRQILVSISALSAHLNSISAGRITKDWKVFKFDDGEPWPELLARHHEETTLGCVADVVAENVETGEVLLTISLKQACELLHLNPNVVKNNRTRKGFDVPYKGWIFYPLEDYQPKRTES